MASRRAIWGPGKLQTSSPKEAEAQTKSAAHYPMLACFAQGNSTPALDQAWDRGTDLSKAQPQPHHRLKFSSSQREPFVV